MTDPFDSKRMKELVRVNFATLDACQRHEFTHPAPFTPGGRSVCSACGGRLDPLQARSYDLGLLHAAQRHEPISKAPRDRDVLIGKWHDGKWVTRLARWREGVGGFSHTIGQVEHVYRDFTHFAALPPAPDESEPPEAA